MAKLDPGSKAPLFQADIDDSEDIEILEIVGLEDEDLSSGPDQPAPAPDQGSAAVPEEEIALSFDEVPAAAKQVAEAVVVPVPEAPDVATPSERAHHERYLRLQADFDNFKKRVERERSDQASQAAADLIARMLPVLDNFERAVSAEPGSEAAEQFRDGVSMIFRQLLEELRKVGLTAVDSVGEVFDPRVHEAVATDNSSDFPPNTVVEELQRGYLLNNRLLRPALVKVRVDLEEPMRPASCDEGSRDG